LKRTKSIVKKISKYYISYIPHFRSCEKLKLVKHLGDLCLVRSKLHYKIDELSEGIKLLYDSYNSAIITKSKNDTDNLILIYKEVNIINIEVKELFSQNLTITNKVERINNIDYLYDKTIEQSIINAKGRAISCTNEFVVISNKISRLNLIEIP